MVYIGRAKNLAERWSKVNYGSISPRNCFKGGQSTNCKMNNYIYEESRKGAKLELYFYETDSYVDVEKVLLKSCSSTLPLNKQKR